jgi:hypothetical protein
LFLPGFDIGAFPNHLNRSSFVAPIARERRKFHRQATIVTRKDCVLEYTGEQLDEADGDLIMALIGVVSEKSTLRLIGWSRLASGEEHGHGRWADIEQTSCIRCGFLLRLDQQHDLLLL